MKRTGLGALLLSLLCVLFLPAAARAADPLESTNHTDSSDYCMQAHDVTLALSQMQSLDDRALYAEIERTSAYAFLIRPGGLTTRLTEGYHTDFSKVERKPGDAGYPVTVTLPEITPGVVSAITYRVYVTDDTPALPDGHAPQSDCTAHADTKSVCVSYNPEVVIMESRRKSWLDGGNGNASFLALFSCSARDRVTGAAASVQTAAEIGGLGAAPSAFPAEYAVAMTFTTDSGETLEATCRLLVTEDPKPAIYQLTLRYVDEGGAELRAPFRMSLAAGEEYDMTSRVQEKIDGYSFSGTDVPAAGVISGELTITASYKKVALPPPSDSDDYDSYHVSIRYVEQETGKELAEGYRSESIREGRSYDVGERAALGIAGYTVSRIDGKISGWIAADVAITVYYQKAVAAVPGELPAAPEAPPPALPETPTDSAPAMPPKTLPLAPERPAAPAAPLSDSKTETWIESKSERAVQEERGPGTAQAEPPAAQALPDAASRVCPQADSESLPGKKPDGAQLISPTEVLYGSRAYLPAGQAVASAGRQSGRGGASALELLLIGLGAVYAAALGGGIASDLRVLKWYDAKKRKAAGV
jgi:hypothetical protein